MKKYFIGILVTFIFVFALFYSMPVRADLPLQGKVIVVDAGHGFLDPGTTYKDIYEKDIVLKISLYLEESLSEMGATVVMTRTSDKDLSNGVKNHRKKTDFDNRIKIINNEYTDMYLSIHLNYLSNTAYYGPQVFYNNDNLLIAETLQKYLNNEIGSDRKVKEIPSSTYMYSRLTKPGVLIECGFLSNTNERNKLITSSYQKKLAQIIAIAIANYYN